MRLSLFQNSGIFQTSVVVDGFTLNDFLTLDKDPSREDEAVTKRYVDGIPTVYDVSQITGAAIPRSVIVGGFGGDLVGYNRDSVLLTPTQITPGTYNRFTVDAKGRVTSAIIVDDNPTTLSWENVINKPEGSDSYISSASEMYVTKPNGSESLSVISGPLVALHDPIDNNEACTLNYVNNKVSVMSSPTEVGTYKLTVAGNQGDKYLRANGAILDRANYPELWELFKGPSNGVPVGGQPWCQQAAFNNEDNPSALVWDTSSPGYPTAVMQSAVAIIKNKLYIIGGYNSYSQARVAYINLDETGNVSGGWVGSSSLTQALHGGAIFATKNYLYYTGGGTAGWGNSNIVQRAAINEDGTLGSWANQTGLPVAMIYHVAFTTKRYAYVIGGSGSGNYIARAEILDDGSIGAWVHHGNFPVSIAYSTVINTGRYVYVIGREGSNQSFVAPIDLETGLIGAWVSNGTVGSTALAGGAGFCTAKRAWLVGGSSANAVYSAPVNEDGTIGTWVNVGTTPQHLAWGGCAASNGYLYYTGASITTLVLKTPIQGGRNDYLTLIREDRVTNPDRFQLPNLIDRGDGVLEYFIRALP